jgi:hypothetical protein
MCGIFRFSVAEDDKLQGLSRSEYGIYVYVELICLASTLLTCLLKVPGISSGIFIYSDRVFGVSPLSPFKYRDNTSIGPWPFLFKITDFTVILFFPAFYRPSLRLLQRPKMNKWRSQTCSYLKIASAFKYVWNEWRFATNLLGVPVAECPVH